MTPDTDACFRYLDALRESGVTNMYGAGVVPQFEIWRGWFPHRSCYVIPVCLAGSTDRRISP